MKALTLWQPWASLIAFGEKKIETRSWPTRYRGPLAIHAAGGWPGWAKALIRQEPFESAIWKPIGSPLFLKQLPFGSMLCVVDLVDCIEMTRDNLPGEPERSFGLYEPGRFMWKLDNIRLLPTPIPVKGRQRIWNPPTDVVSEVWRQLGKEV